MGVDTILQGYSVLGTTVCVILHCRPLETLFLEAEISDVAKSHAHGVKYRLKELDILIHNTNRLSTPLQKSFKDISGQPRVNGGVVSIL